MEKYKTLLKLYAPSVLRISMAMIVLWFSIEQFMNTESWTAYIPDSAVSATHLSAKTLVYFNATFELILGVMLAIGFQARIVAFFISLHLFHIMFVVGYNETGVRDFGLAMATLVVAMNGSDVLCMKKKEDVPAVTSNRVLVQ